MSSYEMCFPLMKNAFWKEMVRDTVKNAHYNANWVEKIYYFPNIFS